MGQVQTGVNKRKADVEQVYTTVGKKQTGVCKRIQADVRQLYTDIFLRVCMAKCRSDEKKVNLDETFN